MEELQASLFYNISKTISNNVGSLPQSTDRLNAALFWLNAAQFSAMRS